MSKIKTSKLISLINLFESKVPNETIQFIDVSGYNVQTESGLYHVDFSKNKVEKYYIENSSIEIVTTESFDDWGS